MPFLKHTRRRDVARVLLVSIGVKLVITAVAVFFIADMQQAASMPL